ncbi:hypothetical protein HPB52_021997 [Rhipicephalus sanguineus]|uniref:Uncharacterized protein n=1 Tax=Rhipicephalus sanguineus TaxID=34632 RepID=A0A9D4Q8P3_RHISA|nr:hypothetical protein HPB52_021997 [Rhipicephalus sanguineus]
MAAIKAVKMEMVTLQGASLNPKEEAHSAARGLTDRVPGNTSSPGDPNLSARTTRYASAIISLEGCCLCHTPRYAGSKLSLLDCPLCGGYADFEHVLWGCASAGPPLTQEEMTKLIKAQEQTS